MDVLSHRIRLKKRIDHGSCFEDLSITPGPGVYEADQ